VTIPLSLTVGGVWTVRSAMPFTPAAGNRQQAEFAIRFAW
jgi:hypothetical protein